MALTFYYLSGSPFAWKVWLSLERKQLAYDMRVLSVDAGDLKKPQYLSVNPRGKVPAIVDDGFALNESSAIIEYLDDQYPSSGEPLWPRDPRTRAFARKVAIEADAFIYPSVRKLVVELLMRKEGQPDAGVIGEAKAALARELPLFESAFQGPFMAGSEPSAADFTIYPFLAVLGRVAARRPKYALSDAVPAALQPWLSRVEALPYFANTIPPHWKTP
jgi:glutathione S-transferase